jgi:hypothetical protein
MLQRVIPAALLLAAAPGLLAAQDERSDEVHTRNDCRLAAQVIETGHPHPRARWAFETIGRCGEEGPPALAKRWRDIAADTAEVRDLINASARLRDRRLFDLASSVSRDPSRPDVVRVGAMILLVSYVDPHHLVSFPALAPRDLGRRRGPPIILDNLSAHEILQIDGAQPLGGPLAARAIAVFREVAGQGGTEPVTFAAAALARTYQWRLERGSVQD